MPKYNDFSMTLRGAYFPSHCLIHLPTSGAVLVAALLDGFILAHLLKADRIHDPFNDYGRSLYVREIVWIRVL